LWKVKVFVENGIESKTLALGQPIHLGSGFQKKGGIQVDVYNEVTWKDGCSALKIGLGKQIMQVALRAW